MKPEYLINDYLLNNESIKITSEKIQSFASSKNVPLYNLFYNQKSSNRTSEQTSNIQNTLDKYCAFCKKNNHNEENCFKKNSEVKKLTIPDNPIKKKTENNALLAQYNSNKSKNTVNFKLIDGVTREALLDSGADLNIIKPNLITDQHLTGKTVKLKWVGVPSIEYLEAEIFIDSPVYTGLMYCAVVADIAYDLLIAIDLDLQNNINFNVICDPRLILYNGEYVKRVRIQTYHQVHQSLQIKKSSYWLRRPQWKLHWLKIVT